MQFTENKTKEGYKYETEQFIGDFIFKSKEKIPPQTLDSLVLVLSPMPSMEGTTTHKGQDIEYKFIKKDPWEDDEELISNKK